MSNKDKTDEAAVEVTESATDAPSETTDATVVTVPDSDGEPEASL